MTLGDALFIHESCQRKQAAAIMLAEKHRILMEGICVVQKILNVEIENTLRAALHSERLP